MIAPITREKILEDCLRDIQKEAKDWRYRGLPTARFQDVVLRKCRYGLRAEP